MLCKSLLHVSKARLARVAIYYGLTLHQQWQTGSMWGAGPQPEPSQRSPELALALPSAYGQDPAELLGMQHALFGTAEDSLPGRSKRSKSGEGAFIHLCARGA